MLLQHDFDPSILRAYDVRGVYGDTLTARDAYAIGRAMAAEIGERGGRTVALGWDGRTSSPLLAEAVARGVMDSGLTVLRVGLGPSPMLYFAVHHLDADGGVMVTGSHNPPEYNGFKLMIGTRALMGEEIQALGRRARQGDFITGTGADETHDIADAYVARLMRGLTLDGAVDCGWDPGNGAIAQVLPRLLADLPGRHTTINGTVDPSFPAHHPDPGDPANMAQLTELVTERGLDIGFAFDGDGDRLGVIDRRGRIVWPDQLLVLLARQVLRDRPGQTVIADVKASQTLFDEVARAGGTPLMWRTGHSLIKAKMRETRAPLAGEMSGHIFFADRWYGFDDALYAALRTLEALAALKVDLCDIVDALPAAVATPEIRIDCDDAAKFEAVEAVGRTIDRTHSEVITVDGLRVVTADGWWLLRASNTQPALVARCEAADAAGLERLQAQMRSALDRAGVASDALAYAVSA